MRRHLLNLLNSNRGRGHFRAEADTNTIWLYDFIVSSEMDAQWFGGVSAEAFTRQLAAMSGDVSVRINSPGGDVFGGQAIMNAIRAYDRGKITAYVDGYAASAASSVAIACEEIVMSGTGAMFMIHNAWTIALGDHRALSAEATLLQKIDANLAAQYAARTGKPVEQFVDLMNAETWFTAQESVDIGLATSVATSSQKSNAIAWDLSAYRERPQEEAEPAAESEPQAQPVAAVNDDDDRRRRRLALARLA